MGNQAAPANSPRTNNPETVKSRNGSSITDSGTIGQTINEAGQATFSQQEKMQRPGSYTAAEAPVAAQQESSGPSIIERDKSREEFSELKSVFTLSVGSYEAVSEEIKKWREDLSSSNLQVRQDAEKRLEALIQELNSEDYARREKAQKTLSEIGVPAKAALLKSMNAPEPEIAVRSKNALHNIIMGLKVECAGNCKLSDLFVELGKQSGIKIELVARDQFISTNFDGQSLEQVINAVGNVTKNASSFDISKQVMIIYPDDKKAMEAKFAGHFGATRPPPPFSNRVSVLHDGKHPADIGSFFQEGR